MDGEIFGGSDLVGNNSDVGSADSRVDLLGGGDADIGSGSGAATKSDTHTGVSSSDNSDGGDTSSSAPGGVAGTSGGLTFTRLNIEEYPQLQEFKDADALAEAFLKKGDGQGLMPLSETASEIEKQNFEQKLRTLTGVPDTVEGYGTLGYPPESVKDNQSLEWFIGKAHELGIPPAKAEMLAHKYDEFLTEVLDHHTATRKEEIQRFRTSARAVLETQYGGGQAYDQAMARARVAVDKIGQGSGASPEEIASFSKIFGDHPLVIRMFEYIGRSFTEQQMAFGVSGNNKPVEYGEKEQLDFYKGLFPNS